MSTPPGPGQPVWRPALEPTRIQRRRRSEALAELLREVGGEEPSADSDAHLEPVPVVAGTRRLPPAEDEETQELPPVPAGAHRASGADPARPAPGRGWRRGLAHGTGPRPAAVALAVTAAALVGFALAPLLPGGAPDDRAQPATPPAAPTPAEDPARTGDPDGAGTLRQGDRGPDVTELQERLRRVPNVYDGSGTHGSYDAALTEAVARFQLWYGIRGDETGVYGDDTRAALESRTPR
ncbi:peptidoglycan-binding protein [Streptomyces sp. NPDC005813]|uniref:peptidoglycan-binding domain-containing protein n=1 Tax=Streptomyces sp. NPDC005813 TaxID=3155592 RepID=UPI0033D2DA9F